MRLLFVSLARLVQAAFFVATSVYCLLCYNAFTYEQFIRPQLVGWLPDVVARHHEVYWLVLLLTGTTLIGPLRHGGRSRLAASLYLAGSAAVGAWLVLDPVLALAGPDARTLLLAILSLVPPVALALVDHATVSSPQIDALDSRRLGAAMVSGVLSVWCVYAGMTLWQTSPAGVSLSAVETGVAVALSLAVHVALFGVAYLFVVAALALAALARRPLVEYWTLAALVAIAIAIGTERVVAAALSLGVVESWVLSVCLAVTVSSVWSGCAWQWAAADAGAPQGASRDPLDIWVGPCTGGSRVVAWAGLLALPIAALALRAAVVQFDWNFLLQKLGAGLVWGVALAWSSVLVRSLPSPGARAAPVGAVASAIVVVMALAGAPAAARVASWSGNARLQPEFLLDRYAAFDASYLLARDLLRRPAGDHADFFTFLKRHSTLGGVAARPVEVNFVERFERRADPPHVFLFIVDSLRRDYLSPYNRAVGFTPAIQKFAGESIVFERAFTQYGATGLSVPAIWAGGLLLHKQYVTPFAPMHALEKLLDASGYHRLMSDDHLVTQLFEPSPDTTLLDTLRQEMDHTLCATTTELEQRLDARGNDRRPIFAMTRPLQLHTARLVRNAPVDPAVYPGFVPGYAAQVAELDRCLGGFVAYLKRTGLYERSVVILTSDHGESLGEDGRWGHAYTLYPEVVRIPLIMHLPAAARVATDRSRVVLSTDITPTLYSLAGEAPRDLGSLYGDPIVNPVEDPVPTRRRESFLLSSSYGPVYAMLRHNGRSLFIADAVQGREFAYEMMPDGRFERQAVTETLRAANRHLIRQRIEEIAAEYRFRPSEVERWKTRFW
jgi:hypothetical protein